VANTPVTIAVSATDPQGLALHYVYVFGDNSASVTSTSPSVTHSFPANGNYQVTVYAVDPQNVSASAFTSLLVTGAVVQPPTISAISATPNPAAVNQSVTIAVTASDAQNATLNYYISFGDGNGAFSTTGSATHAYAKAGLYGITAFVQDPQGNTVSQSIKLTVGTPPPNSPPAFTSVSATPNPATANAPVAFKAVAVDPDGDTVNYYLDFGDGSGQFSTDGTATHTYVSGGTYQVVAFAQDTLNPPVSQSLSLVVNGAVTSATPPPTTFGNPGTLAPTGAPDPTQIVVGQFGKKALAVGFGKNAGKNALSFTLQTPALKFANALELLQAVQNKTVLVIVGNTPIDTLTMSSDRGTGAGSISFDWRTGTVAYRVKGPRLPTPVLAFNGAVNATVTGVPLDLPVFVSIDGVLYGGSAAFTYTAKANVAGVGK
jgi:PKD repeat protein